MYLPRGDVVCQIVSRVQDSSKSKVAQLDLALLRNQDVFWLHVSMDALEIKTRPGSVFIHSHYLLMMTKLEAFEHLPDYPLY